MRATYRPDWDTIRLMVMLRMHGAGLTRYQLAGELRIPRASLYPFMDGTSVTMRPENLFRILGWLGVYDWREIMKEGSDGMGEGIDVPDPS